MILELPISKLIGHLCINVSNFCADADLKTIFIKQGDSQSLPTVSCAIFPSCSTHWTPRSSLKHGLNKQYGSVLCLFYIWPCHVTLLHGIYIHLNNLAIPRLEL